MKSLYELCHQYERILCVADKRDIDRFEALKHRARQILERYTQNVYSHYNINRETEKDYAILNAIFHRSHPRSIYAKY